MQRSIRGAASRGVRLALAAALAAATLGCGNDAAEPGSGASLPGLGQAPLNVVLITIDTLRADALGAYSGVATSPAIDTLAADGVLFEQCVTSIPSTLPSHASIMTGKQPYAHGARSNQGYVLAAGNRTLAEALGSAGYATAGEVSAAVIGRRLGLNQGFASFRDIDSFDVELKKASFTRDGVKHEVEFFERHAVDVSSKGIAFLRSHAQLPFFLWLHYFDPHRPYAAPREFAARFPDNPYHAEVAFTDYAIGLLIEELEHLGLRERTLVVLTSDHGEGLGDHGEETHSYLVYDSTMHVPLIFWGPPSLPRGVRIAQPVRTVDIAPTILDWIGQPPLEDVQGVSLASLIRGEPLPEELPIYGETIESFATFGTSVLRFLRLGSFKYIHKVNPELYDLSSDPKELTNLAAVEPGRMRDLRGRLEALIREAPARPEGSEVDADAELSAQLAALGYVGDRSAPKIDDELATLELSGPDPNETVDDLFQFASAIGLMTKLQDPEGALELLLQLETRYPDSVPILRMKAGALVQLGRAAEAREVVDHALAIAPDDTGLRLELVRLLQQAGELEAAEREARTVLRQSPCEAIGISRLSNILRGQKRYADQAALLRDATTTCDTDEARNEYAYFLATTPEASQRDGAEALRLALVVTQRPGGALPNYIDTLAAALAETGDFAQAAALQRKALEALEGHEQNPAALAVFRSHLAELEAGRPIRED